ncbi:MAG: hypothetical protein WDZ76_14010 [Pseudohongiellaceae bacterium]
MPLEVEPELPAVCVLPPWGLPWGLELPELLELDDEDDVDEGNEPVSPWLDEGVLGNGLEEPLWLDDGVLGIELGELLWLLDEGVLGNGLELLLELLEGDGGDGNPAELDDEDDEDDDDELGILVELELCCWLDDSQATSTRARPPALRYLNRFSVFICICPRPVYVS